MTLRVRIRCFACDQHRRCTLVGDEFICPRCVTVAGWRKCPGCGVAVPGPGCSDCDRRRGERAA